MLKNWRPCKFQNVEELEKLIQDYKDYCNKKKNEEIPDVEGLAFYLSTTRKTLREYCQKDKCKGKFSNTLKKAMEWIAYNKKQLAMKNKIPAAIFCFDFKNNHGYVDKKEIEQSGEIKVWWVNINIDE